MRRNAFAARCLVLLIGGGCSSARRFPEGTAAAIPAARAGMSAALTVPAAPIPVRAAGHTVLAYELFVLNTGARPLRLERVEIQSAEQQSTIASYQRAEIDRNVKFLAPRGAPAAKGLEPGVRAIIYMWIALDSAAVVPSAISHRVVLASGDTIRGNAVAVRASTDLVFEPPVPDGDWWIGLGPSNGSDHRREVLRVGDDTVPHLAQRFAIDWVKMNAAGEYARDHKGKTNADWFGYGEPVRAVADARVAAVVDGIPDNTSGENSRAVAMTARTVFGNCVVLDLGRGSGEAHRFALYGHLKPGTIQVRTGDRVTRGQVLGNLGNSGNSDGPHLHFQVTEASDEAAAPLRSEGVPFVIDAFSVVSHDPDRVAQKALLTPLGPHRMSLPVEGDVIRIVGGAR